MATGKVARRTAVVDVSALLDSPEVEALIAAIEAVGDKRGRKGFGTRALVGACFVKSLFALPTWTWVAALIAKSGATDMDSWRRAVVTRHASGKPVAVQTARLSLYP